MRKQYPKVPHYDHESVDNSLYDADDLVLLEKLDGSNFRLCLYDERYADAYGSDINAFNPVDGDVFIGTKGTVRGRLSDNADDLDGNFSRVLTTLRNSLDTDALRLLHDEYDTPLLLFGEHMVKHTLDYGYDTSPPPAFLGFDVFQLTEYTKPTSNPFEQRFEGFLTINSAFHVFDQVGLETIPVVEDAFPSGLNPETITVPMSSYAGMEAEGVIIRSDSNNRRTKLVTEEFQEKMREEWGMQESDADSGADLFVARYVTNARIRKTVQKLVHRRGINSVDVTTVTEATVADAWEEEMYDIQQIGIELIPSNIYPLAHERCESVINTMRTNAQLNETSLDRLWEDIPDDLDEGDITAFTVNTDVLSSLVERLDTSDDPNDELVRALFHTEYLQSVADDILADAKRPPGRWLITSVTESCSDTLWYDRLAIIANLSVPIIPTRINDALIEYITEEIDGRDDVDTSEKPENWQPDIDDADTSGLDSLF